MDFLRDGALFKMVLRAYPFSMAKPFLLAL